MALRGKRKVCLEEVQALLEETKASHEETKASHEETKAELCAMKERMAGAEKKIRHLQWQLEKYEGQYPKERRHDVEIEASAPSYLQLKFTSQPLPKIFTMTKVKGENSVDLVLIVVDPMTGKVISSGLESSMDVELVLVNAECTGAEAGNQKYNIVAPRRGKPQLLMGDTILKLNGGSVAVGNLKITDNSSWVSSRSFKLVAKVSNGYFHGKRVKEAITNPFIVVEGRLKGYQKHHPPHPKDDVWRLEGISKNGAYHQRLKAKGIYNVEDFLKSLQENRNGLRDDILKMTPSDWEDTVNHAQRCTPCGPTDQPSNPRIWKATEVVKQQSIQAVYSPHVHINTLPFGSSNSAIQSEGCLNGQLVRGSYLLEGQYTGDCTSTLREPLNAFGSDGTLSPGSKLPARDTSCLSELKEDDDYRFIDEFFQAMCPDNVFPLQQGFPDLVDSANGCSNIPTDSTAENHQAHLEWSKLIVAMAFSVRIVAFNDMNI